MDDKTKVIEEGVVMQAIEHSRTMVAVGYSDRSGCLFVEFCNGNIYEYNSVPREVFGRLMAAESRGSYFHKNIRMSFEFKKVWPVVVEKKEDKKEEVKDGVA